MADRRDNRRILDRARETYENTAERITDAKDYKCPAPIPAGFIGVC